VGPQLQVPPSYSAIHVAGQRASDRVRSGELVTLPARPIEVHALDVLAWNAPVLTVRIHCSKGTYVRSIARDWGRASGFGATVTRLRRTSVGPFSLPAEPMEFKDSRWTLARLGVPVVAVEDGSVASVLNGRDPAVFVPALAGVAGETAGLEASDGRLLAVVERAGAAWSYLFVDRGRE